MASPGDILLYIRMRGIGTKYPVRTVQAAREHSLNIPLFCSVLTQETAGGLMLWGHDPTIFVGGYDAKNGVHYGPIVTEISYKAYLAQRGPKGRGGMQGCGSGQLTYYAYQDRADVLGGCWKILPNLRVTAEILAANIAKDGLGAGVAAYNGSGPSAKKYADQVIARANVYAAKLGLPRP